MFEHKKVVIWGNGKFQKDFEYIFKDIHPAYYVTGGEYCLDEAVYPAEYLLKDKDKENLFIIICDFDKAEAEKKLLEMGFEQGKSYIEADDLFDLLDEPENLNTNGRKLAFWGSGQELLYFESNVSIKSDVYIDRNRDKCGTKINGRLVVHPDDIKDWSAYFIVITTLKYYPEISITLQEKGLCENADFVLYRNLLPKKRNLSEMMRMTVYAEPIQAPACTRPFRYLEIAFGGNFFCCCPAWVKEKFGDINTDTCDNVWNSTAADIFRLSIINKTFCFCEWESCSHIDSHPEKDLSGERYAFLKAEPIPETMLLGIDGRCNLKCRQCRKDYLSYSDVEESMIRCQLQRIIDSQWMDKVKHVVFASYGEVFYSPIYKSLLFKEKRTGKNTVGILCNGLLFTEEYFQKLYKQYGKINVSISVDAACAETYHIVRAGSWEKLNENIKNLVQHRKKGEIADIRLSFCVQLCNINEIYDFIEYGRELGVDQVHFQKIHYTEGMTEEMFHEVFAITGKEDIPKENVAKILAEADLEDPFVDWGQLNKYIKYAKAEKEKNNR